MKFSSPPGEIPECTECESTKNMRGEVITKDRKGN